MLSRLSADPNQPQTAPRYDLTDPFTTKLLAAAGVAYLYCSMTSFPASLITGY